MSEALENFGRIVAKQGRDRGLDELEKMLNGQAKAPAIAAIAEKLNGVGIEHRDSIRAAARAAIDAALHGLLFSLYENEKVDLIVDGVSLRSVSDGYEGDYLTQQGWIGRYSKYPE
jgi:hypothetical protein